MVKNRILEAINRANFSVSVQKFSHLSNEIVYGPHRSERYPSLQ